QFDGVASGTVNAAGTKSGKLTIIQAATFEFALSAEAFVGGTGGVVMTICDASGQAILTLSADAGQPTVTAVRYLTEGKYTVQFSTRSGATAPALEYDLFLLQLSEGAGPYATNTGSNDGNSSPPPPPDSGYTYSGSSTSKPSGTPYYF